MTIEEFLSEQGLGPDEVKAIVGNEKQAKAMSAALAKFEEGSTALSRSQREIQEANSAKEETARFWEQKTQELQGGVDRMTAAEKRAAQAEAEAARRATYLKSLADQGYDVPEEMYKGAASSPAAQNVQQSQDTSRFLTREDWEKQARAIAPDLVTLTALSNEYAYLYGQPYTAINDDFQEAQKHGKPLRDYVQSKYDFSANRQEKQKAAEEAAYQDRFKKDIESERKKWAEEHGSNPNTRSPLPSRFDKLVNQQGFDKNSWASADGRKANRESRLQKFENLKIQ